MVTLLQHPELAFGCLIDCNQTEISYSPENILLKETTRQYKTHQKPPVL